MLVVERTCAARPSPMLVATGARAVCGTHRLKHPQAAGARQEPFPQPPEHKGIPWERTAARAAPRICWLG